MGSHFHNWTDYNGVTFLVELLEWGRKFSGFLGQENSGRQGFKNGKIHGCNHNDICPKVTKMGSIVGHRIDYNGMGALRGQRHIPSKT